VLFVGNSYFCYSGSVLSRRIARRDTWASPFQYKAATIANAPLAHHSIEHLTAPGKLGQVLRAGICKAAAPMHC
jgi:hypothetical protein